MNSASLAQSVHIFQQMPIMARKVKGMTTRKDVCNFAYECVVGYATYDDLDEFHSLDVRDLPDFTRHEFASLIMAHDENYACEASGADNSLWCEKMLPALIKYLSKSTDPDAQIEFAETWRDCTTKYLEGAMQELINDALAEYNS